MAHTGIYVPTIEEFEYKCGLGVSVVSSSEAYANSFIQQAEALINSLSRKVYAADTAAFTALPATTKYLLTLAASNIAAIYAITYDMSGYSSRIEAEDVINILRDGALQALSLLRDKKTALFLEQGT